MTTIETYRVFGLCVAFASGAAMLQGCSDNGSGGSAGAAGKGTTSSTSVTSGAGGGSSTSSTTSSTATTTTSGTGGSTGGGNAVTYCMPAYPEPQPVTGAAISDFEGEAGTMIQAIHPSGNWDVDVDGAGTAKGESFKLEPCGTTGTGFHFKGMGHTVWGADAAAAIVTQLQPVDVSAYSGMSFVIKSTTANSLIFKVQNPYSQPPCGSCKETGAVPGEECYAGFIKIASLPASSSDPITVKWADLSQQTWGYKPPGLTTFDAKNLVSVAFAFDKNVDFDVCIDDIKFVQ